MFAAQFMFVVRKSIRCINCVCTCTLRSVAHIVSGVPLLLSAVCFYVLCV
jgi:hypothetical protein